MTFANNPEYEVAYENGTVKVYIPKDLADYHQTRRIAGGAQAIFAAAGADRETIRAIATQVLSMCNSDEPVRNFRTDVGTLMQNLLYRIAYPVDEHVAARMGATYSFLEGEDPDQVKDVWTQRKMALAEEDPDLYAFFLILGAEFMPDWTGWSATSIDTDYLNRRREALKGLTLPQSPTA